MPLFEKYIGIDYSGADKPRSKIKGLAVVQGSIHSPASLVYPSTGSSLTSSTSSSDKDHLWSREEVYLWLRDQLLSSQERMIIGIDHGLSYPLSVLQQLELDQWDDFLKWSYQTWQTTRLTMKQSKEQAHYTNSIAKRLVEREFVPSTKSVVDLDRVSGMQGAVSYSTHTGLAWIYRLRYWQKRHGMNIHFWPFDGKIIPKQHHVIVEAYPSLYKRRMITEPHLSNISTYSEHERDAYYIAAWMQERDQEETLAPYLSLPTLSRAEYQLSLLEGWVLGCL